VSNALLGEKVKWLREEAFQKDEQNPHATHNNDNGNGNSNCNDNAHKCADCQLQFKIFSDLKGHVDQCHHSLLKDCEKKYFYCVANQR
jgi:hypothetical protein